MRQRVSHAGSSPCIRGRFSNNCTLCSFHGFIPVHTGRIVPVHDFSTRQRVHPRVYGADENVTPRKFQQPDSSPCIRGRFAGILFTKSTVRLIPAHAGRMESTVSLILMCWTHPRAYGADSPTTAHPVPSMGSSPCIRGRFSCLF